MMIKKLGIDLGSASCGWAIREGDEIIRKGVVTFSTGMVKGQGGYSSPAKDRREARSKRRLIQARKYRKWELLKILSKDKEFTPLEKNEFKQWSKYQKGIQRKFPESERFKKWLACDFTYEGGFKYKNPYEIRVKGLDEELTSHELGRALYHIVQRRGYKDIGEKDKETKNQIERRGISGFDEAVHEHRTIAETFKKDFLDNNKRVRNEYPYRDEYEHELELLCEKQGYNISKKKKGEYDDEFVKDLWKAIIWQRPLRSQKDKIGKCTLEPNSHRIPVSHPLFEIFRTLQFINTIKTVDENGVKNQIPKDFREGLLRDEFLKRGKSFKFSIIKTYIDKKFQKKMEYNYLNKWTGKYDSTVSGMPVCKELIDLFDKQYNIKDSLLNLFHYDKINEIPKTIKGYSVHDLWHIIFNSNDTSFIKNFAEEKLGIKSTYIKKNDEEIRENKFADIQQVFMQGYSDLSAKAIKKIIPFLQEGYLYNEAVLLAKLPKLLGEKWKIEKEKIALATNKSSFEYSFKSKVIDITNGLINIYKGLEYDEQFAYKNTEYVIDKSDNKEIENASEKYFGEKTWANKNDRKELLNAVRGEYQLFFTDSKRSYRTKPTQTELFKNALKEFGIELNGELYHHSDRKILYHKPVFSKKYGINLLAVPLIDSIKNPMFNKAMSILRKLINELIIQGEIDEDTEIIVEVARELNDNNKRAAIERYQNDRKRNREKYRVFLDEFKTKEKPDLNVNARIDDFELWTEQIFEKTIDEKGEKQTNINRIEILKEKNAIDRYELWMEQKGQCMYTGKMIRISQLFSAEIEIEHTIPRSLLPDNTKANLTVCFSKYNSDVKNNKIPFECPNFEIGDSNGTAILPRLAHWQKIKDKYQKDFDDNKMPKGNEDEKKKNERIQRKHYAKMHLDYWSDKINRFTSKEIKESWVRRQLTDTQMVSKYAREFLKTYFKKVSVEKGSITAEFRKIYSFQEEDEIKSRNKHTHHAIDAAVLTLIPNNASRKKALLEKAFYFEEERKGKQFTTKPFKDFHAQKLIKDIENSTLIFNYTKDKIISQTFKKVRKRGVVKKDENSIEIWMRGSSVRGDLYGQTFLSKIKNVELDETNKPKRDAKGNWEYKQGKEEFTYATKKPIEEVKAKYIKDIIDPDIRKLVEEQKKNDVIWDHQGNKIRKVRVKVNKGRVVKERLNYRSKNEHKNFYYASAGEIPYAILLEKIVVNKIERKMIPVAIHEVAKVFKEYRSFNVGLYLDTFHKDLKGKYSNWKLLKVGQKVLVLQNDNELEEVADIQFQKNRLYRITQFSEGNIWLQYHLESREVGEIKDGVKSIKSDLVLQKEEELNLDPIIENKTILDTKVRKKDFEDKMYKFSSLKDFRMKRLVDYIGEDETNKIKEQLDKYKVFSSKIELEVVTPLLKTSKDNWNFLYEGEDFEIDILGKLNVLVEKIEPQV